MILSRHFVREIIKLGAALIAGLFVVYLSMRLAASLGEAAEGKVAPQHIARMVGLKMLVSMKDLIPMSLYLATFAAITRIQLNSEWVAMRAAGMSHQSLLRAVLTVSLPAAVVVGLITLVVGPQAERSLRELKELTENEATIAGVKAGRFRELAGGKEFYAERIAEDGQHLERSFVQAERGNQLGAMRADRASVQVDPQSRDRFAVFEHGIGYGGIPGQADYVITEFSKYSVRIEDREPTQFSQHIGFIATDDLLRHDDPAFKVELQSRFGMPLCTLLSPVLALLIGAANPRGRWYLGLVTAISAYFAYTNLLQVGRALMQKQTLPAVFGLWPVHLLFGTALVMLLLGHRRMLRRRRAPTGLMPA